LIRSSGLHTVCEAAICPNMAECWGRGTATFMILGDTCTRHCRFCAVKSGNIPHMHVAWDEPGQVAEVVSRMELGHVVVTSVTRDDLEDGGAGLFTETVRQVRLHRPGCTVELLIPDFEGKKGPLELVMASRPEILGHNVETVPRLYPAVRPQARYDRSLKVLERAGKMGDGVVTKSGVMVGLGETRDELLEVMTDLRKVGCDILTAGQYLRPTARHLPVARYYTPEEFASLKQAAYDRGFLWVESGPLVRSSYRAESQAQLCRARRRTGCRPTASRGDR
jgi:lipoic acid synthetase